MAQKNWLEIEINNKNHKKEKNTKKYKKVLAKMIYIQYNSEVQKISYQFSGNDDTQGNTCSHPEHRSQA